MQIKNKIKKIAKSGLAAFLAGYIAFVPAIKAQSNKDHDFIVEGNSKFKTAQTIKSKGFFELSGTFRLDNTGKGSKGHLYSKIINGDFEMTPYAEYFVQDFDYGNKTNNIAGIVGIGYKEVELESGFKGIQDNYTDNKTAINRNGNSTETEITQQNTEIKDNSSAFGLNFFKKFILQFNQQPKKTNNNTRITNNYENPDNNTIINVNVKENSIIKENNQKIRFASVYEKNNFEIGGEISVNNHNLEEVVNTKEIIDTKIGSLSESDTFNFTENNNEERNEIIGTLKGGFNQNKTFGYGQVSHCISDELSSGAVQINGDLNHQNGKVLGLVSFGANIYDKIKKAGLKAGIFYSTNAKKAFKNLNKSTRESYGNENSIVSTEMKKNIQQKESYDNFIGSLGNGIGASVGLNFNDGYKPGIQADLGGAYRGWFGYVSGHVNNISNPETIGNAGIILGNKKITLSYEYNNKNKLYHEKDVKRHTVSAKLKW